MVTKSWRRRNQAVIKNRFKVKRLGAFVAGREIDMRMVTVPQPPTRWSMVLGSSGFPPLAGSNWVNR